MNNPRFAIIGFGWVSIAQFLSTVIRFLGGIYLARMIDPVFFGQQALSLSVVTLVWAFVMIGENHALIKQQKNIHECMRTLLFIRLSIVVFLVLVMMLLWWLGWLPGSKKIQFYIVLLFFAQVPAQVMSIYISSILKNMLFPRIAFLNFFSVVSGVLLACILAYKGHTIWALLWLFMGEQLVIAALAVFLVPAFFLPKFDKNLASEFFHYSKYFIATSLLDRFGNKISSISIGSLVGETSLGYYNRAYSLGVLQQMVIVGGLTTVTQPYFARMQGDNEKFGKNFELVSSLLIRVSCAAYVCLALILPGVISWLYGEKWLPTVPLFRLMLPFAILHSCRTLLRNTHKVAGSIKFLTLSQLAEVFVLLIFLYPMIYWKGVFGAVVAVNISTIVGVCTMLYYLRRFADFSVWRIFGNPVIAALSAASAIMLVSFATDRTISDMNIAVTVVLFGCAYLAGLLVLEYSFIKKVVGLIRKTIRPDEI